MTGKVYSMDHLDLRPKIFVVVVIIITAVLPWHPSELTAADNDLVASATSQSRVAAVSEMILTRAYAALGYRLNVSYYPSSEALYKSNKGEVDAELVRIAEVSKAYPNLIQVPESLFDFKGMAFSWDDNIIVRGEHDLWGRRVGIVRGIQWAEKLTEGNSPIIARDVHQLFELLADREIDVALEAQLTGEPELQHFLNRGLVMLLDTVEYFPVFHFLNKKHADLVIPLSEEIQKMKKRGDIYQIFKDYYQTVTPNHN